MATCGHKAWWRREAGEAEEGTAGRLRCDGGRACTPGPVQAPKCGSHTSCCVWSWACRGERYGPRTVGMGPDLPVEHLRTNTVGLERLLGQVLEQLGVHQERPPRLPLWTGRAEADVSTPVGRKFFEPPSVRGARPHMPSSRPSPSDPVSCQDHLLQVLSTAPTRANPVGAQHVLDELRKAESSRSVNSTRADLSKAYVPFPLHKSTP